MIESLVLIATLAAPAADIDLAPGSPPTTVAEPLFDLSSRWVPGDVRETRVTVRNGGPSTARVRFAVDVRGDAELAPDGAVQLSARIGDGGWRPVAWSTWFTAGALDPGESVPVEVRAAVDADAGDATQDRRIDLGVRWQAAGRSTEPGDLPGTGTGIAAEWIVAGLAAVAAGLTVRRVRGERR